jgi:hypothetical protein
MNRRVTNAVRTTLDYWLPAVIREHWPFPWLTKMWLGPNALVDFKDRAFAMTDREFVETYRAVGGSYLNRPSDTTPDQAAWLLKHLGSACTVLEIGPGVRALTGQMMMAGHRVVTLDLSSFGTPAGEQCVLGVAERLPFADKSVDAVILAHVIEHVRSLTATLMELERVARERVLIVTPRQRFYNVTFDYHLHFFYSLQHLASHVPCGSTEGTIINGDLCLLWRLE